MSNVHIRLSTVKLNKPSILTAQKCTHVGVYSSCLGHGITDERLLVDRLSTLTFPVTSVTFWTFTKMNVKQTAYFSVIVSRFVC